MGINIRPYWKECLQQLSNNYLIIVFTASHQSYADSVIDYLDPQKKLIKYRLYRNHCIKVVVENDNEITFLEKKIENEFIYVKDLRIIRNVKLENMIIIDNSVLSFSFQLDNGIPILPYYSGKNDNELVFLKNYLTIIANYEDLRYINRQTIKLFYFYNSVKESTNNKNNILPSESDQSPKIINKGSNNNFTINKLILKPCENPSDSETELRNCFIIDENNSKRRSDIFIKQESSNIIFNQKLDVLKNENMNDSYFISPCSANNSPQIGLNDVLRCSKNPNQNALNLSKHIDDVSDYNSISKLANNNSFMNHINAIKLKTISPINRKNNNISAFKDQLFITLEELKEFVLNEK